jgi:hypothetical protein
MLSGDKIVAEIMDTASLFEKEAAPIRRRIAFMLSETIWEFKI